MFKRIFERVKNDERVTGQIYKFGFEAFVIMSLLLSGLIIIQNSNLNFEYNPYKFEYIVLTIGVLYFVFRTAFMGVISFPDDNKEKKKLLKYIILANISFGLLFGTYISIRNSIIYLDGTYNFLSLSILLITALSAILLGFVVITVFFILSNYFAKKNLEE